MEGQAAKLECFVRPRTRETAPHLNEAASSQRFNRVAMRCERTDTSYSAIISFACGLMLVKSVHTA